MPQSLLDRVQNLRVVLDAIPSLILVVDPDLRVIDTNSSARNYLQKDAEVVLKRLCGEVLHCVHEADAEEECGRTPFCPDCILRKAVTTVTKTKAAFRARHRLRQRRDGSEEELTEFFVTASPLYVEGEALVLMVLEDVTELLALRHLVTMCSVCSSIRNEDGKWEKIHQYLSRQDNVVCSHGVCPSCLDDQYRNVDEMRQFIAALSTHNSGRA
jgi:hypothetical protein